LHFRNTLAIQRAEASQTSPPKVQTAQTQIQFLLAHAATSQVAARTTAEQIRFTLRDVPAKEGSNTLPDILQSAVDMAAILDRLADAPLAPDSTDPEGVLTARIADLERKVAELTAQLADADKAKQAAEAKAKANGLWANYKASTGKALRVTQFALAGTGIPAGVLYLLGPNHPLVQALLQLLK